MNSPGARHRPAHQRYLPVGFLVTALALAALLLPTVLRPPQDLQNTSASFSPDAPPDDTPPEAILQSLRKASSSTAGSAVAQVAAEEVVVVDEAPVKRGRPSRGRCYGDPPRQTESLYSALCVPAFTGGDNGGATTRGVTKDEIRVAIAVDSATASNGPLSREFSADDTETEHDLKVWQAYFNENFEFNGRYLQLYPYFMSTQDEDGARAAVREAVNGYGVFALTGDGLNTPSAAAAAEAVRQKVVTFIGGNNPVDFYQDSHPYAYSFTMDSWQTRYVGPELACKHFVGKPPGELNKKQDTTFDYNAPRKWGLVLYQDEVRAGARKMFEDNLARCGGKFIQVVEYNLTDNQQSIAATTAKMKQAGVTTIMVAVDPYTPPVLTSEAERIQYFPEWLGVTGTSGNSAGDLMNDNQSTHYISIASDEIPRPSEDRDWFRAYKEIDPEGEPTASYFRSLQQLSGGIQHASAKLTPQTFWLGLSKQPCRTPDPLWSIGGCYKNPDASSPVHYLGDYTYSDYVALQWFDLPNKQWCYVYNGRRFRATAIPTDPIPWFDLNQCVRSAEAGVQG